MGGLQVRPSSSSSSRGTSASPTSYLLAVYCLFCLVVSKNLLPVFGGQAFCFLTPTIVSSTKTPATATTATATATAARRSRRRIRTTLAPQSSRRRCRHHQIRSISNNDNSSSNGGGGGGLFLAVATSPTLQQPAKRQKSGKGSQKEVDSLLASALMNLNLKDRTAVEEKIHGVMPEPEEESPEEIHAILTEFETILVNTYMASPPNNPELAAYRLAINQQFQYVTSPANGRLRLRFVWAEQYDIEKAVKRFLLHLNMSLEMYGPDALQRPLQVEDLTYNPNTGRREATSGALKYLKAGAVQVLPGRDRAGRRVFYHDIGPKGQTVYDEIKASFFIFTVVTEEESFDRKNRGYVYIGHIGSINGHFLQHYNDKESMKRAEDAYPLLTSAMHLCISATNDFIFQAANMLISALSTKHHAVIRLHQNTSMELQHHLMTFGLPTEDTNFPLTTGGKIKRKNLSDWIQYRRNVDDLLRRNGYVPQTVVGSPSPKDVLFSMKHKRDKRQLGNQELRRLIDRDYDAFHSSPARSEQRDIIIRNVIEEIVTQWQGRFLVWNDEMLWWDELVALSSASASASAPSPSPGTGVGPESSPSVSSLQSTATRSIDSNRHQLHHHSTQELETKIRKKFNSTVRHTAAI
mmetsp:Transcript_25679/g.60785  ORF Transcript_25679/g.60785 Transcript_25679/m.60785 type:complete len:636 (+) Transcript_25679:208-2115(+)